jgi:hypothetical protein
MLTIILDSLSIHTNFSKKNMLVDDLLSRDRSLFKIYRTSCPIDQPRIKEIPSLPKIYLNQFNGETLEQMYQNLLFHPRNSCQEQFFFCFLKYANQRSSPDYIHESVYVTENPIFFEKYLRGGEKIISLRDLFPNLILVNLDRMKEVLDYYEIKEGHYYFNRVKLDLKEEWQIRTLFFSLHSLSDSFIKYHSLGLGSYIIVLIVLVSNIILET